MSKFRYRRLLILRILAVLEEHYDHPQIVYLDRVHPDVVTAHCILLHEAGLILGFFDGCHYFAHRMTLFGYEFLEELRVKRRQVVIDIGFRLIRAAVELPSVTSFLNVVDEF